MERALLEQDEPSPVEILGSDGASLFVLAADHAGRRLPRALGTLGLDAAALERHIAWDIGIRGVAHRLAAHLGALLIAQTYSRLAIDCNRPPSSPGSIATVSEATAIPGNLDLSRAAREARRLAIFKPYHDRLAAELDRRAAAERPSVLVALHSFTPVYLGQVRPWQIGVLYHRDDRLARPLLELLAGEGGLVVGDNQPYKVGDATDYTIPVHGEKRGILHVELEIRQDLIADEAGQEDWARRLADLLPRALERAQRWRMAAQ